MKTLRWIPSLLVAGLVMASMTGCTMITAQPASVASSAESTTESAESATAIVDEGPEHHLIYAPDAIAWQDGPGSLEPGAQFAVLEGSPGEAGVFTLRIKMPDGYFISPHSHPGVERVTVISGVFNLGSGEELNPNATVALEAGSYTSMPPGMRHYAIAEGETVIQLTSVGPWELNYVNEEDDPRLRD
jgi:quercetin dioxygenase-like cupin family protein